MEELARVERLKTLGKGKDTVFKISYQDKVTFFIELVKVVEGWLRLNSLDKETLVRPLVIFSTPVFNYWELMKRWQHEGWILGFSDFKLKMFRTLFALVYPKFDYEYN